MQVDNMFPNASSSVGTASESSKSSTSATRSPLRKVSSNAAPAPKRRKSLLPSLPALSAARNDESSVSTKSQSLVDASSTTSVAAVASPEEPAVVVNLDYPDTARVPSKSLVAALYEESDGLQKTDLAASGLLSLEEVLLPAVAFMEHEALKAHQAVVQRDGTAADKQDVVMTRQILFDCMGAAAKSAKQSRSERRSRLLEAAPVEREQRRNEQIKKLPRNQALWREVVYLMTEVTKLQKEEKLWKEASEQLDKREAQLQTLEQADQSSPSQQETITVNSGEALTKIQQAIEDIEVSTARLFQGFDAVSAIATEADRTREELYQRYRRDHQFHGYQGVKDPKGLLRSLSQSQDI